MPKVAQELHFLSYNYNVLLLVDELMVQCGQQYHFKCHARLDRLNLKFSEVVTRTTVTNIIYCTLQKPQENKQLETQFVGPSMEHNGNLKCSVKV